MQNNQQNNRTIRICKKPIHGHDSQKFHCIIFDPELQPGKSRIDVVRKLMKQFKNPASNRCEEQTMETPLSPAELAEAITKRVQVPGLTFQVRQVAGNPNVIAEFYAENTDKNMDAVDAMDFIMAHQKLLQIPVEPVSKSVRTLYDTLSLENKTPDFYEQGRLAG